MSNFVIKVGDRYLREPGLGFSKRFSEARRMTLDVATRELHAHDGLWSDTRLLAIVGYVVVMVDEGGKVNTVYGRYFRPRGEPTQLSPSPRWSDNPHIFTSRAEARRAFTNYYAAVAHKMRVRTLLRRVKSAPAPPTGFVVEMVDYNGKVITDGGRYRLPDGHYSDIPYVFPTEAAAWDSVKVYRHASQWFRVSPAPSRTSRP